MKLKTIIAALMLAGFAQSTFANECENLVSKDPSVSCEEIIKRSNEHANEVIKYFTDIVRSVNDIAEGRYDVQTDTTNTAQALVFLKHEKDRLNEELTKLKAQSTAEKAHLMIHALATAQIDWQYYQYIQLNQMPGMSDSEVEQWKKAFSKNNHLYSGECKDMCYKINFEKKADEYKFLYNLSPYFVARDLLMRINKIETQIEFSHRDFNIKQEIENIEYDLNALSYADVFDPNYFKRNQGEFGPNVQYAIFIRDYINSLLAHEDLAIKEKVGLLEVEKEKLESEHVTYEDILFEHQHNELIKRLNHTQF